MNLVSTLCVCSSMAPPWSIYFPSLFLDWRGSQLDPQSHSGRNLQLWPRHQPASKGVQVLKANVHLVGLAALNPPVTSFPTSITDSLTTAQALKEGSLLSISFQASHSDAYKCSRKRKRLVRHSCSSQKVAIILLLRHVHTYTYTLKRLKTSVCMDQWSCPTNHHISKEEEWSHLKACSSLESGLMVWDQSTLDTATEDTQPLS